MQLLWLTIIRREKLTWQRDPIYHYIYVIKEIHSSGRKSKFNKHKRQKCVRKKRLWGHAFTFY
jgi:hypothetical protein